MQVGLSSNKHLGVESKTISLQPSESKNTFSGVIQGFHLVDLSVEFAQLELDTVKHLSAQPEKSFPAIGHSGCLWNAFWGHGGKLKYSMGTLMTSVMTYLVPWGYIGCF